MPTRAWELGFGAILAVLAPKFPLTKILSGWAYFPALGLLLIIPFLPFTYAHPGLTAGVVCLAAVIFIAAQQENITRFSPVKILARVGDISYSLYLVHWPIMVFFYSGYMGEAPKYIALVTIPLSFLAAYCMYRFVEKPCIRTFTKPSFKHVFMVPGVTALVALISIALVSFAEPGSDFVELRKPNKGLASTCDYSGKEFQPRLECRNGENPTVFVWGDSYAMHLVPGIAKTAVLEQATFSACLPFVGFAPMRKNIDQAEKWADRCFKFNDSVLKYLATRDEIETVVLGSPWRQYVREGQVAWSRSNGALVENATGLDFAVREMSSTMGEIRKLGKKIIIFGPPPASNRDTSGCLERIATGKVVFESKCEIDAGQALRTDATVRQFLEELGKIEGVSVVNLSDVMCNEQFCITQKDGVPIYRDKSHLSVPGSVIVFDMLNMNF